MDLGIKGKWALVGGASKGLGWGCASALAQAGVHLVMVSRGAPASWVTMLFSGSSVSFSAWMTR